MAAEALPTPLALPPLVALVGATGTGKSNLALSVARELGESGVAAEIINADAMQLYRGMDIGTAKVPESQREEIPHHVLDIWDVTREASVADYQGIARAAIRDVQSRGAVPLLVGGSGLYVSLIQRCALAWSSASSTKALRCCWPIWPPRILSQPRPSTPRTRDA